MQDFTNLDPKATMLLYWAAFTLQEPIRLSCEMVKFMTLEQLMVSVVPGPQNGALRARPHP